MLSKKQLEDAAKCEKMCCRDCRLANKTALACLAMLERLEWSRIGGFCPICRSHKYDGHEPNCELSAMLKESEGLG